MLLTSETDFSFLISRTKQQTQTKSFSKKILVAKIDWKHLLFCFSSFCYHLTLLSFSFQMIRFFTVISILFILQFCFQVVHSAANVTKDSDNATQAIMPRADPFASDNSGYSTTAAAVPDEKSKYISFLSLFLQL